MSNYHIYITKSAGVTTSHATPLQVEASGTIGDSEVLTTTQTTANSAADLGVTAADINQCCWTVVVQGSDHGFIATGSTPDATATSPNGTVTTAKKGVTAGSTRYFAVENLTDKLEVVDA